jgi:hypothetical protein
MNIRKALLWICILAVVLWTVFDAGRAQTQAQSAPAPDSSAVLSKLDTVLDNQKTILAGLAAIKEELRIIKIRITQSQ